MCNPKAAAAPPGLRFPERFTHDTSACSVRSSNSGNDVASVRQTPELACVVPLAVTCMLTANVARRSLRRSRSGVRAASDFGRAASPRNDFVCKSCGAKFRDFAFLKMAAQGTVDFLQVAEQLKVRARTGWRRKDVKEPESIAAHMYRMALAALALPIDDVNVRLRTAAIALIHDVAESVVGDLVPGAMAPDAKHAAEAAALRDMVSTLAPSAAAHVLELHDAYEAMDSREARLVKDLDRLDMLLTALFYETREPHLDLSDFWASCEGKFKTDEVKPLAEEAYKRYEQLLKDKAAGTVKLKWHGPSEAEILRAGMGADATESATAPAPSGAPSFKGLFSKEGLQCAAIGAVVGAGMCFVLMSVSSRPVWRR
jgi:putative hydrolase of HD superfamily